MTETPITERHENTEDHIHANTHRPQHLTDFIGQKEAVQQIHTLVSTAFARNETADHILLSGPPGLGKTTLANIVSHEQQGKLHTVMAPTLTRGIDLISLLLRIQKNDVVFLDEIHRLPKTVAETLYSAMEDFTLHITTEHNGTTHSQSIPLKPFTLVGATTRPGMLPGPLRDRFGLHVTLNFYPIDDLTAIIERDRGFMGLNQDPESSAYIAQASRGTPRIAKRLLRRVRDYAQKHKENITSELVHKTLSLYAISSDGLTALDRRYIGILATHERAMGVKTIASAAFESQETLEVDVEPILLQRGLILITPRGRILSEKGLVYGKEILAKEGENTV